MQPDDGSRGDFEYNELCRGADSDFAMSTLKPGEVFTELNLWFSAHCAGLKRSDFLLREFSPPLVSTLKVILSQFKVFYLVLKMSNRKETNSN
jgi:hypothetical protein